MGICFPICFISQAALVLMLPKDCGFQQLLLVGQMYLFWFSQGRLNWAPGAVLTQLLLSDSSFWNWWSQGHATTFCHFSRLALHLQEKRARGVLSTSLGLWKSLHSQLQNQPPLQSPTHSFQVRDCIWDRQRPLKLDVGPGTQPSPSRIMSISQSTQVAQGVCVQVKSSLGEGGWCGTNPWRNNPSTKQCWESRGWLGAWKFPWRPQLLTSSDKQTIAEGWFYVVCELRMFSMFLRGCKQNKTKCVTESTCAPPPKA